MKIQTTAIAWFLWFFAATAEGDLTSGSSGTTKNTNGLFIDEEGQCPPSTFSWLTQNMYFQIRDDVKAVRDVGNGRSESIPTPNTISRYNDNNYQQQQQGGEQQRFIVRPFAETSTALSLVDDASLILQFVPNGGTSYPLDISFQTTFGGNSAGVDENEEDEGGRRLKDNDRKEEESQPRRKLQEEDGWFLSTSYLVERGQDNLILDHTTMTTDDSSVESIGLSINEAVFYCEVVEFHFSPMGASDPTAGGSASVILHDFMVAPFFEPKYGRQIHEPHCELPVVSPCTNPNEICHAVNGQVRCVENGSDNQNAETSMLRTGSSIHPLVQYEPPIAGLTREEYLDKYHCVTYPSPVRPGIANQRQSFLYWVAGGSFLQASNAQLQIDQEDSTTTVYRFNDQYGREPILYGGQNGNLLERADDWTEDDQERRIIFYFDHNVDGGSPEEGGWSMAKLWVYNDQYDSQTQNGQPDWVYAKLEGLDISVPTSKSVFHCQSVEFDLDYFDHSFYPVNQDVSSDPASFTQNTEQSQNAGSFTMEHVYLMAYQDTDLIENSACDLDEIYNPCDEFKATGHTFCHAKNGVVSCLDGPNGQSLQASIQPELPVLRSFSPGTSLDSADFTASSLLCEAPQLEVEPKIKAEDLSNVTLKWQSEDSYLYATDVNIIYPGDGTVLTFQDQLDRPTCISKGGNEFSRDSYWWEGNLQRQLSFGFEKHVSPSSWSLVSTSLLQNEYEPDRMQEWFPTRFQNNNGIIGANQNTLFHCDFVQFNYENPVTSKFDAQFTGWDFVIGSYMENLPKDGSAEDICDLPVYNPCVEESPETPFCQFQDGSLSCSQKKGGNMVLPDTDLPLTRNGNTSPHTLGSLGVGPCRPAGGTLDIPIDDRSEGGGQKSDGWSISNSSSIAALVAASVGLMAFL